MPQSTASSPHMTSSDPDYFRRRYADAWAPGAARVRLVVGLLAARGIRCEVDGFMADSQAWATERPAERHRPDITVLAS